MVLGAFSCLTNCARGEDIPEGKIYSYKEEDGVTREMEIHFPKGHDATTESSSGYHHVSWRRVGWRKERPISLSLPLLCRPRSCGGNRIVSAGDEGR